MLALIYIGKVSEDLAEGFTKKEKLVVCFFVNLFSFYENKLLELFIFLTVEMFS